MSGSPSDPPESGRGRYEGLKAWADAGPVSRLSAHDIAADRRQELERDVATMRALGVMSWNGIVLGPPPVVAESARGPLTAEEERMIASRDAARHIAAAFAASTTRPNVDAFMRRATRGFP